MDKNENYKGNPVAIVLGGTIPHKTLIEKLSSRGYYTILVDYFNNPPAASSADLHAQESALDYNIVMDIAKKHEAKLVICTCLDQQLVVACKVAEKLKLPAPFSYQTALKMTNKELMKQEMLNAGIPTANHIVIKNNDIVDVSSMQFPLIVKPADSNGAAGVSLIESKKEIGKNIAEAMQWSRTNTVILEEFMKGIEVSVYTFIENHKAKILFTAQRFSKIGKEKNEGVKCFCSLGPVDLSDEAKKKMQWIADKIASAFELNNTPMFYQAIVHRDDVRIIEFAPRLGGGLCFRTVKEGSGFDLLEASIDSFLGNKVRIKTSFDEKYYLIHQIHGSPGIFGWIQGDKELLADGIMNEIYMHKKKEAEINNTKASGARIAAFIAQGNSKEELSKRAEIIVNTIEVMDIEGKDISDRSLFLTKDDLADETGE